MISIKPFHCDRNGCLRQFETYEEMRRHAENDHDNERPRPLPDGGQIKKRDEKYPWRNESVLRELYEDKKLSKRKIADRLGCSTATVTNWMNEFGIESRPHNMAISLAKGPLEPYTDDSGYEVIQTRVDYEAKVSAIHRLLAVAEYGFEAVADNVVHHKNGVTWDNRPENIELLEDSEHKSRHAHDKCRDERGRFA